jgi:transposase-like protein
VVKIANQEGIHPQTLYSWRNKANETGLLMPTKSSSKRWTKQNKFSVVLETCAMNIEELSRYCREKGLYPDQVKAWREACINGIDEPVVDPKVTATQLRALKKDKQKLEQQLRRKDKALAEAAALLVLQKKYQALWEDEEK